MWARGGTLDLLIQGCEADAKNPGPVESQILRKNVYLLYQEILIKNISYHFQRAMQTLLNHISMKPDWSKKVNLLLIIYFTKNGN